MAISKIRNLALNVKSGKKSGFKIMSSNNFILYGNGGKSTIALAQLTDEPILVLTPAGGSLHLQDEFSNAVIYSISDLNDLTGILVDLENNFNSIRQLGNIIEDKDKVQVYFEKAFKPMYSAQAALAKDKKVFDIELNEEFQDCLNYAKTNTFPFHSIVLEEIDIISGWLQEVVEKKFGLEVLGEEKSNLSSDWSEYKKELLTFYVRFLKLPVVNIFATSDKLPKEKQGLNQRVPNICMGAAARSLISLIGNCFYVENELGKYTIQILQTPEVFIRSKIFPIKIPMKDIPVKLDITNNPQFFWEFVKKCDNLKKNTAKEKK